MIEAEGLTKRFGGRMAVDAATFRVERGETVGFLGPNGAGKSTTMRMLTGYLAPSAGAARVNGHDVEREPLAARRSVGYLPESNPLYRDMRVGEFLRYRARIKGLDRGGRERSVAESMDRCRVAEARDRVIGQLSKGYRQRVGLADSLLGKPPLLILDEPTVGLDPNQVVETRQLIRELGRDRTVFLSTHVLQEVEWLCPRVLIIDRGRLVAEGDAGELARRHARERVVALEVLAPAGSDGPRFGASVAKALRDLPGVRRVEERGTAPGGGHAFGVAAGAEGDLRLKVSALARARQWLVQELRLEPLRLEDLFARLTGHGTDGDGRPAGPERKDS